MNAPAEKRPQDIAAEIVRVAGSGALATVQAGGAPFASYVSVATAHDGTPILLLSQLAVHTRNLARDRRASLLLVDARAGTDDPVAAPRLTVIGIISGPDPRPVMRQRFLTRHEEAAGYAGFSDFDIYRLEVEGSHLVAGFGQIVDLEPGDIMTETSGCSDLLSHEGELLDWLNADAGERLGRALARLHGGDGDTEWRATGIDPRGVDIRKRSTRDRLGFGVHVTTAAQARRVLDEMAG